MNLRMARKIWWSGRWRFYRADVLERAITHYLSNAGLSLNKCQSVQW